MDLSVDEVSLLLNVSESKVRKLANEGKMPAYKLKRQYRFSRQEVEDWVLKGELVRTEEKEGGFQQFCLTRALHKGGVFHEHTAGEKEALIEATTDFLGKKFSWDACGLALLLIDRERLMSTALNNGIAVPHTRDFLLDTHFDVVTVVFPKEPIPYGALDGLPVHTLFFLFACEDKRHLHLLAKIAHLSSQPEALEFLKRRPSEAELLQYVKNWESTVVA